MSAKYLAFAWLNNKTAHAGFQCVIKAIFLCVNIVSRVFKQNIISVLAHNVIYSVYYMGEYIVGYICSNYSYDFWVVFCFIFKRTKSSSSVFSWNIAVILKYRKGFPHSMSAHPELFSQLIFGRQLISRFYFAANYVIFYTVN